MSKHLLTSDENNNMYEENKFLNPSDNTIRKKYDLNIKFKTLNNNYFSDIPSNEYRISSANQHTNITTVITENDNISLISDEFDNNQENDEDSQIDTPKLVSL